MSVFHQAGNIRHDKVCAVLGLHQPKGRNFGCERVVGYFWSSVAHTGNQRGLSRVWHSDKPHVGHQLQFQKQPFLLTGFTRISTPWRLVSRSGKSGIASSASSAGCHQNRLTGTTKIGQQIAGLFFNNQSSHGDVYRQIGRASPLPVAAASMRSVSRPVELLVLAVQQSVYRVIRSD
jgi:hypothetical protein